MKTLKRVLHAINVAVATCLLPTTASAGTDYHSLVVFGDSLSDPGNAYVLTGTSLVPPYTSLIPDAPYARGGHHLTNGASWIEQLAEQMGLQDSVGPALREPGAFSNYAIDRSRACSQSPSPSYINLTGQVGMFLSDFEVAPADALYVIFIGGNDIRDALISQNPALIGCAVLSIQSNLLALINAGAKSFLVANAPNLAQVPAVAMLGAQAQKAATDASLFFNGWLESILSGIEQSYSGQVTFYRLNTFDLITRVSINHAYLNAVDPCINISTGMACSPANDYLFWDGIHPTVTGHALIAEEAASILGLQ